MSDWNHNGKYDLPDNYMDYHFANSNGNSRNSSDWWKWLLFAIIVAVCPPLGIVIFVVVLLFK